MSDDTTQDTPQTIAPLISDLDIMLILESVLINDEVINVLDAQRALIAVRDHYEAELATLREELADTYKECIDFTMSYGIGDEERYSARIAELTGRKEGGQ